MAKKQIQVTVEMLREAYIANLEARRKPDAEAIADFTEMELAERVIGTGTSDSQEGRI